MEDRKREEVRIIGANEVPEITEARPWEPPVIRDLDLASQTQASISNTGGDAGDYS